MNSAFHIFRKDLRKFGPLIAFAIFINAFGYCVVLSNLDTTRIFSGTGFDLTKVFHQAPLVRWIVVFLLSVWVILEDRAVGDRVAWMTRPIYAWQILAAKFGFLVVAIAFPAGLVGVGVALWLKAPLAAALAVGTVDLLLTLFGAAISASIAVICSSMNQALLLAAGSFGGVALAGFGIFQLGHMTLPPSPINITAGTAFIVAATTTSLSALATLGHQYATRRTLRTFLLAIAFGLTIGASVHYWPFSFWRNSTAHTSAAPTSLEKLRLVAGNSAASFQTDQEAFGKGEASVLVPLRLEGSPPDRLYMVHQVTSTLAMDDGQVIRSVRKYGYPNFENNLAALFSLGFSPPVSSSLRYVTAVECPMGTFTKLQGRSGRLTAEVDLHEKSYEIVVRLPVRVGAEMTKDGHLCRILSIHFRNGHCEVGFQFVQISPILGTQHLAWPSQYVLVNSKRGEFSEYQGGRSFGTGSFDMTLVTSRNTFATTRSLKSLAETGKVDASWLNDAELIFLVANDVNGPALRLPVSMDKLTIPTTQATQRIIVITPDGTRSEYEQ